jgi:uncharacterized membrane protein YoaK (UPF0700 family)
VALVKGSGADAARASVALGGFCVGAAVGVMLIGPSARPWPMRARAVMFLELAALLTLLVLWAATGLDPLRYLLIALAGIAMGSQSVAVRASDVRGVNTTYMTSTLVNAIAGVVQRVRGGPPAADSGPSLPGTAWLIYAIGALIGALTVQAWHAGAVAIALVVVASAGPWSPPARASVRRQRM